MASTLGDCFPAVTSKLSEIKSRLPQNLYTLKELAVHQLLYVPATERCFGLCQQHLEFPSSLPSKCYPGLMLQTYIVFHFLFSKTERSVSARPDRRHQRARCDAAVLHHPGDQLKDLADAVRLNDRPRETSQRKRLQGEKMHLTCCLKLLAFGWAALHCCSIQPCCPRFITLLRQNYVLQERVTQCKDKF